MKKIILIRIITFPFLLLGYIVFSIIPSPFDETPLCPLTRKIWGVHVLAKIRKLRNPWSTYIVVEGKKMTVY